MAFFDQEIFAVADTTVTSTGGEEEQGQEEQGQAAFLTVDAEQVAILRFPLGELAVVYELERVELLLFHMDTTDGLTIAAYAASGRWDESSIDLDGVDLGGASLAETDGAQANHYVTLDLTDAVRPMAAYNVESLNLLVRVRDDGRHQFVAREHGDANLHPRLRVVYAAPATALPTVATTPAVRPLPTALPLILATPPTPKPPTAMPSPVPTSTPSPLPTATPFPSPTVTAVAVQMRLPTLTPTPTSAPPPSPTPQAIALAPLLPTVTPAPTASLETSVDIAVPLLGDEGASFESPLAAPPLPANGAIQLESPLPAPTLALDVMPPGAVVTSTPALLPESIALITTTTPLPSLDGIATPYTVPITPVITTTLPLSATESITPLLDVTPTLAIMALPPDMLAQLPSLTALAPQSGYPAHNNGMPYSPTSEACAGCHRAHDGNDPTLASQGPEEVMCYTCHGGATGNIQADFQAPYRHPIDATLGVHNAGESIPESFSGATRHVECADCHEPHDLAAGTHAAGSSYRAPALQGIWGVSVSNGPGGSAPSFARVDAVVHEYELCFKCHSGWSSSGQGTDVAAEANPNNMAHHAIEAPGRNQPGAINPNFDATFVAPWNSQSTLTCSDCHGGTSAAGPHGSTQRYILRTNESGAGSPAVFCYNCHRRDVYGDVDLQNPPYAALSRFTHPTERDHTQLSGEWGANQSGIWCKNCHAGDTTGALHGTNRGVGTNGLTPLGARLMNGQFVEGWTAAAGRSQGTCWASCHPGAENYRANYDYAP